MGNTVTYLGKFDPESRGILLTTYIGFKKYKEAGTWLKKAVEKFSDIDLLVLDPEIMVKVTELTGDLKDCDRYKVLNRFYDKYKRQNKWGLDGTIQHNLFEKIISREVRSEQGQRNS